MQNKNNSSKKRKKQYRSVIILVCVLFSICLVVGGTVALLIDSAGPIENVFTSSEVATEVSGDATSGITVKNTGDTDAYIRAYVNVTWRDNEGNIYAVAPVLGTDKDYTMGLNDDVWKKLADGYYYYPSPVAAGTAVTLITEYSVTSEADIPDGYELCVEVIASGIQSAPAGAAAEAWGVDIDTDGNITGLRATGN